MVGAIGIEAGSRSQRDTFGIGQGVDGLRDVEKQPGTEKHGEQLLAGGKEVCFAKYRSRKAERERESRKL